VSARPDAAAPCRVLALVSDAFGAGGGIAAYNRELLAALAASPRVAAVRVLVRRAHGDATPPRGVVQERPRPGRARYAAAALARGLARRYDWVFCGHLHLAALARAVAGAAGAALWVQAHGIEAWREPPAPLRAALARARLVTAVSRVTRRRLLRWADLHPSRVRVLANTWDPRFRPGAPPPGLRERLGGGRALLLTVSRLDPQERYKGHDQVLRALTLPALAGPHGPVYVVAGEGADRARLQALARELGIAQRVRFLGAVPDRELPDLYRAADAFAMPSTGEGFGIVFLEAAACGVPVVAGNGDGARDALRDGRVGRLVDPRDPAAVAAAIAAALAAPVPPAGFEVFRRECFRRHLECVLGACPPVAAGERWR